MQQPLCQLCSVSCLLGVVQQCWHCPRCAEKVCRHLPLCCGWFCAPAAICQRQPAVFCLQTMHGLTDGTTLDHRNHSHGHTLRNPPTLIHSNSQPARATLCIPLQPTHHTCPHNKAKACMGRSPKKCTPPRASSHGAPLEKCGHHVVRVHLEHLGLDESAHKSAILRGRRLQQRILHEGGGTGGGTHMCDDVRPQIAHDAAGGRVGGRGGGGGGDWLAV
mmetsp:Transcript_4043/g.10082  ORF Transcript_4043/g.10082 Transcript_4043/m.10082 type:complete len:219 (-) Transcript_4043:487-1143(-)